MVYRSLVDEGLKDGDGVGGLVRAWNGLASVKGLDIV